MLLEKGKISNSQLSIIIIGFVLGTSVIISPGRGAGRDSWLALSIGLIEGLIAAWIFTSLFKQFENKTIIEINSLVYGKFIGKIISSFFIWYLFHLGSLGLSHYGRFFNLEIYPATPRIVLLISLILVCALTVSRGIEVLARCSLILVAITMFLVSSDTLLLIPHFKFDYIKPIMDLPIKKLLWYAHSTGSSPFGETVAFLMILPFADKPKKGFSILLKGLLISGLILIIISVRNTLVLGKLTTNYTYPSFLTAQVIDVGDVLTRVEVVIATILITMGFIKVSVLVYGTVLGTAQILNLRSYLPLIIPTAIIMVIMALTNVENTVEMINFVDKVYPIYVIPFEIVIPLITLIIAKLRKLPQKGEVKQ
jgi:spore germination protein KB